MATPLKFLTGVTLEAISTGITPSTSDNSTKLATTSFVQSNLNAFTGTSNIVTVGTIVSGVWSASNIGVIYGGTGQNSYTTGDLLQATSSTTLGKLASVATGNALISGGVGVVSSWGKIGLTTHVSGTLLITNGGTGQTTANSAFNALAPSQTGNSGKPLVTDGTDTSWSNLANYNPSSPTASQATGNNSIAYGNSAIASGEESIVLGGANNTSSSRYTSAIGNQALSDIQGGFAQASGRFSVQGDAQTRVFVLRTQTTNNTATELFIDGTGGSVRLVLPNNSTWFFRCSIVARRTDADNESAAYEMTGCIDRNATAGSTALVGTRTRTTVAEDNAPWQVEATADTTTGSLKLEVTGQTSKTINWVCRVELTEVIG